MLCLNNQSINLPSEYSDVYKNNQLLYTKDVTFYKWLIGDGKAYSKMNFPKPFYANKLKIAFEVSNYYYGGYLIDGYYYGYVFGLASSDLSRTCYSSVVAMYNNKPSGHVRLGFRLPGSNRGLSAGLTKYASWHANFSRDTSNLVIKYAIGKKATSSIAVGNVSGNSDFDFGLLVTFGFDSTDPFCGYIGYFYGWYDNKRFTLIPCRLNRDFAASECVDNKVHYKNECGYYDTDSRIFHGNINTEGAFNVSNILPSI